MYGLCNYKKIFFPLLLLIVSSPVFAAIYQDSTVDRYGFKSLFKSGFDASKPTPFNGENKAGPLAFVTRQIVGRPAKLGPLCTKPNSLGKCDP